MRKTTPEQKREQAKLNKRKLRAERKAMGIKEKPRWDLELEVAYEMFWRALSESRCESLTDTLNYITQRYMETQVQDGCWHPPKVECFPQQQFPERRIEIPYDKELKELLTESYAGYGDIIRMMIQHIVKAQADGPFYEFEGILLDQVINERTLRQQNPANWLPFRWFNAKYFVWVHKMENKRKAALGQPIEDADLVPFDGEEAQGLTKVVPVGVSIAPIMVQERGWSRKLNLMDIDPRDAEKLNEFLQAEQPKQGYWNPPVSEEFEETIRESLQIEHDDPDGI